MVGYFFSGHPVYLNSDVTVTHRYSFRNNVIKYMYQTENVQFPWSISITSRKERTDPSRLHVAVQHGKQKTAGPTKDSIQALPRTGTDAPKVASSHKFKWFFIVRLAIGYLLQDFTRIPSTSVQKRVRNHMETTVITRSWKQIRLPVLAQRCTEALKLVYLPLLLKGIKIRLWQLHRHHDGPWKTRILW